MGRTGITSNDVSNAIAKLQGKNINLTVDNIRDELGTGSKTTIAKYLREWKSKNEITNTDEAGMPLEVLQFVRGLWDKFRENANSDIQTYKEQADIKINEAQQAYLQKQQAYTQLQSDFHALEEKAHQQEITIESQKAEMNAQTNDNEKCLERIEALSLKNEENKSENERLHQLLKNTQDNLTHYQQAVQTQRQEQALLLEKQRSEHDLKISDANLQIEQLKSQLMTLQSESRQLSQAHENLNTAHQKLKLTHDELVKSHQELSHSESQINSSYQTLLAQQEKLERATENKADEIIELKAQIKSANNKNHDLESSLSKSDNKIQQLRHELETAKHEKVFLEGQFEQLQKTMSDQRA